MLRSMRNLDDAYKSVLIYCKHPRTMKQILYGDLAERLKEQGILGSKLQKIVQELKEMDYIARNRQGEYYTIVEVSQFYREKPEE